MEKGKIKEEEPGRIFLKPGKDNQEDRINFIKFWVNYIKNHKDKEWSRQQNLIIDSQIS
jgi:hypothetical protein